MKRLVVRTVLCSLLCMSLIGCGNAGNEIASEMGNELGQQLVQDYKESTGDYVYDYQVSMEPIPKEIADLGGPCQGTIHAFPSKIEMALTEQKMEEDPELKAEVEKRRVEVEQYLEEEVGKDFSIDGVVVESNGDWQWICTEIDTDYQFALLYCNDQYYATKIEGKEYVGDNDIYMDAYYAKYDTLKYAPEINEMIEEVFPECFYHVVVREQEDETAIVTISVIQYTNQEVDKSQEQIKILELWNRLKERDDSDWYLMAWIYCPEEYESVMERKYNEGFNTLDTLNTSDEELISTLVKNGELTDYVRWDSFFDLSEEVNVDTLLEDYKNGTYDKNAIWSFWIE